MASREAPVAFQGTSSQASSSRHRLAARLRAQLEQIEAEVFARVRSLAESDGPEDPAYALGLRAAVSEAVAYILERIERKGGHVPPIPAELAVQARRAAQEGVRLDTALRRCVRGSMLMEEFIVAAADGMPAGLLRQILREQGDAVDLIIGIVSTEYLDEVGRLERSSAQRDVERVRKLLVGDVSASIEDLDFDFDGWSLGMIAVGDRASDATLGLAAWLGCRLLRVPCGDGIVWAWLGCPRRSASSSIEKALNERVLNDVRLAVGEQRSGLDGWRLTHWEAKAALQVLLRGTERVVRARDVLLLSAVLGDDALTKSLLENYMAPLYRAGKSGPILSETLRAYFDSGCNAAAAAARLNVTRHTVQRRIRLVERTLGQLLPNCHAHLEVALRVNELTP